MAIFRDLEFWWKSRGQSAIHDLEGDSVESSNRRPYFEGAYECLEVVGRGTDLIVNACSEIDVNITGTLSFKPAHGENRTKQKKLLTILNFRPNQFEDIAAFRSQLYMDLVLTGNCYQYYDGRDLWQLPSELMTIETGKKNKIDHYLYNGQTKFFSKEIIHTRDNAAKSIYTGTTRLRPAAVTIRVLLKMLKFQELFFDNGAIPGLIITTPNILAKRIKDKLIAEWQRIYKPDLGAKRPIILDGDMKISPLTQINFKELDFETSVEKKELKILKALGVPPVLLDSGNNANLRPNIQLFYELTVLPLTSKLIGSYENFFAYDMEPDVAKVRPLRPELTEAAQYYQGLVNAGIMTINEARLELRLEESTEEHADKLRIPVNVAGSAVDPSEGGRPTEGDEDEPPEPSEED